MMGMLRLVFPLILQPEAAEALTARSIILATGIRCGADQCSLTIIIMKVIAFLASTAVIVCTVLFLIGAFYVVLFAGKEERVKTGKDLMIGSLVGLAIIMGAYAIVRTFLYTLALS